MSSKPPIGRALGLGAASHTHHWWLQRVGSAALLPLGVWFAVALLSLPDFQYATAYAWLARPWNAIAMLLFIATAAQHSWIGVDVIVEDYVQWLHDTGPSHGFALADIDAALAALADAMIGDLQHAGTVSRSSLS